MFCPKCSRLVEYDPYFGRLFCTSCNWRSEKVEDEEKFKIEMNLNWWDCFEVTNCIICSDNKRAKIFSGHLRVNEGTVGAGFCSEECLNKANLSIHKGYLGWWRPEYGLQYRDLRDED